MKKNIAILSLLILSIAFIFVGSKMAEMHATYNGIGEVISDEAVEKTGSVNAVTAIVFDFRGYDTLGESFVLFTAVCGTTAVLRKNKKKGEELHE